jgi:hypothetical protein
LRREHPEGDLHQGGLPRAILAQQRVDASFAKNEVGPAQGLHGAESLGDSSQFQYRGLLTHDARLTTHDSSYKPVG